MKSALRVLFCSFSGFLILTGVGVAGSLDELSALAVAAPEDYGKVFDKNLAAAGSASVRTMSQRQLTQLMLEDLDSVRNMLAARYAPAGWKREQFGWDLDAEIRKAKERVSASGSFSVRDYHELLKTLLNSTRDYHVSVSFHSTEVAYLPFTVTEAGGRYFISGVYPKMMPAGVVFPFKAGDELVSFDGRPVGEVIADLNRRNGVDNARLTDLARAAQSLAFRAGAAADATPEGVVSMSVRPVGAAEAVPYQMSWTHVPELIAPQPFVAKSFGGQIPMAWLATMMVDMPAPDTDPRASYGMGNKDGFLPDLGEMLWQAPPENSFRAYVYRSPASGGNIGYVRIPTYSVKDPRVKLKDFAAIIPELNRRTGALVIDQTNNPGGSVFYLYALAAMLTDTPLRLPEHRITLTQADIADAIDFLRKAAAIKTDEDARKMLDLGGYPVTADLVKKWSGFFAAVMGEWNSGRTVTGPLALFGVDGITPNPDVRYSKPIMILTNQLDFSGGDFFPAIMQDNGRALVFGERTAGAGGVVKQYERDNDLLGVAAIHLTSTIAERPNGLPIENLGVTPDIGYAVTPADVQGGYAGYVAAADAAISGLIK